MKKVLALFLVAHLAACSPKPVPDNSPEPKATPVANAPKTTPIPIPPLTAELAVPHTAPIPAAPASGIPANPAGEAESAPSDSAQKTGTVSGVMPNPTATPGGVPQRPDPL